MQANKSATASSIQIRKYDKDLESLTRYFVALKASIDNIKDTSEISDDIITHIYNDTNPTTHYLGRAYMKIACLKVLRARGDGAKMEPFLSSIERGPLLNIFYKENLGVDMRDAYKTTISIIAVISMLEDDSVIYLKGFANELLDKYIELSLKPTAPKMVKRGLYSAIMSDLQMDTMWSSSYVVFQEGTKFLLHNLIQTDDISTQVYQTDLSGMWGARAFSFNIKRFTKDDPLVLRISPPEGLFYTNKKDAMRAIKRIFLEELDDMNLLKDKI